MILSKNKKENDQIDAMFAVGAHFGYDRSRRHPSVMKYIFGRKNNVEIIDLEKTAEKLQVAKEFVKEIASRGEQILFVGGKKEAQATIEDFALKIDQPYVSGRWIGGTLTNFEEIRKRVKHYLDLVSQRDKGELAKYKKKERMMIDREIERLEIKFSGISNMEKKPAAVFIVDADREDIARDEAISSGIPVISLSGSDCNFDKIDYVIPANDSSIESIKFFVGEIVSAFEDGKSNPVAPEADKAAKSTKSVGK